MKDRYALFAGRERLYEKRYDSETKAIRQRILHGEYEEVLERCLRDSTVAGNILKICTIFMSMLCMLSGFAAWKSGDYPERARIYVDGERISRKSWLCTFGILCADAQVYYNIGRAYEKVGGSG